MICTSAGSVRTISALFFRHILGTFVLKWMVKRMFAACFCGFVDISRSWRFQVMGLDLTTTSSLVKLVSTSCTLGVVSSSMLGNSPDPGGHFSRLFWSFFSGLRRCRRRWRLLILPRARAHPLPWPPPPSASVCVFADFSGALLALLAVVSWQPLWPELGCWAPLMLLMRPWY